MRLALFLHMPLGLELEPRDVDCLLEGGFDCESVSAVESALISPAACRFVESNRDWPDRAYEILILSEHHGIRWSCLGHADYPESWRGMSLKPMVFSYLGEPCWRTHEFLSVVGSRTPATDTILWMQRELSEFLRGHRAGVVSGGARGVDQWSHRLCADSGRPTIAVLPSGLLNPYPSGAEPLWQRIRERGGCTLSTCSLYEPMRKSFFHLRNRWIAGLGRGCFVAEANRRSGSLITAKCAGEEGRDLCTLPVSPLATQGQGNLDLLMNNATLLRDHRDLAMFWSRISRPGSTQRLQSDQ